MPSNENHENSNLSILKQLESLIEESLQAYELENGITNSIDEMFHSMKIVTEFLSFSINIEPEILSFPSTTKITLTPSLNLLIVHPNGKQEQKRLDEYKSDIIIQIVRLAIPMLLDMIRKEKAILTDYNTFFRSATKQLKQLHNLQNEKKIESVVEEVKN